MAKSGPDWFFREWVTALSIRYPHAWLQKELGYSDGKASNVLNGTKRYDKNIINDVSAAMKIQPYELLMPPELANAIRVMRKEAPKLAADADLAEGQAEIIRLMNVVR